jgi:dUTP diphosphatase
VLAGDDIRRRGVVESIAPEALQPNGIDLTLDAVWLFEAPGVLGTADRGLPSRTYLEGDAAGWLSLDAATYGIRYGEVVQMPPDCGGLCFPRSSLLRMGCFVPTAVWDAGYRGRGEGLLVVANPHGIRLQRGARIAQLVLFTLSAATAGYSGRYQDENSRP